MGNTDNRNENLNDAVESIDMKPETPSLVSRCLPFILDENGEDTSKNIPPVYTLDSVDDIIKSFENKADERISGLYSDKPTKQSNEFTFNVRPTSAANDTDDLIRALEKRMNEARAVSEEKVQKENVSAEVNEIKTYQSSIDNTRVVSGKSFGGKKANVIEATRQFTAIDPKRDIKPKTENISDTLIIEPEIINDVPHAETKFSPLSREQSNVYDDILDDLNGYTNVTDAKKFGSLYIKAKKSSLLKLAFTIILTIVLAVLNSNIFQEFKNDFSVLSSAISLGVFAVILLLNARIFKSFAFIFGGDLSSELPFAVTSVFTIIHSLVGIISNNTGLPNFNTITAIAVCFSALAEFFRSAYTLDNFKRIANSRIKSAFTLIKENDAVTIADDAVEGNVLVGAGQKCTNILGFVRSSQSYDAAAQVISVTTLISLIISVVICIVSFVLTKDFTASFSTMVSILCIACFPATMLINILPMKKMSESLRKYRSQVPGYINAGRIEQINTLAIDSSMLFPEGAIELINMKVVGTTSIDKILIDCAALTSSIGSPLAPIFTDIAGTREKGTELPEADSYKYEEKMGISGWIENRHLFIGNRTLLEAHGMAAAPIDIDRKILKNGAFPVYIAADGKTEAILVVKYTAKTKIKYELSSACNMGITLLINNSDPNITNNMVCDYFELFDELVKVMPSKSAAVYKKCTSYDESTFANASFMGDIGGILKIATSCIRLKSALMLLLISALVIQFGSIAAAAYLIFSGVKITMGMIGLYQIISAAITFILSAIYKL